MIKRFNSMPSSLATLALAVVGFAACGGGDKPPATPDGQNPQQQGQWQQQPPQGQWQQQPPQGQWQQQPPQQQPGAWQQPPQQQPGAPPAGQPGAPPAGQPGAAPGAAPNGAPLNPLDPAFLQQAAAAAAAMMQQPGGAAGAVGDPSELGLKAAAAKHAPGMTPEGGEAKQAVQEGQHVSMGVTMQAGKCYTIIGFGAGVKDLDLTLLAPPFYNMSAGQDGMKEPTAVIGSGKNAFCPITPFPVQYKLDIFAKSGGGNVAVQVFSKTK